MNETDYYRIVREVTRAYFWSRMREFIAEDESLDDNVFLEDFYDRMKMAGVGFMRDLTVEDMRLFRQEYLEDMAFGLLRRLSIEDMRLFQRGYRGVME
jgi:hypothetical protein